VVIGQEFNSLVLNKFNSETYQNILSESELYDNEFALSDKVTTGFKLKKGNRVYFLPSKYINNLPLKVKTYKKIIDRSNVFHLITDAVIVKLKGEKTMEFKELVDTICGYKHTNPKHFLLYKLLCIIAYINRVNWRVATRSAFGKDSVCDAIRDLANNCARIDKATPAKLDYVLKFPFILCNEIASLKKEEKEVFLQFGLSAGGKATKYTKPTRKSSGTKEIYDISKLSLCFTYNIASFYRDNGSESFDDSFPEQFLDRFIPFLFDGFIDIDQFKRSGEFDIDKAYEKHKGLYIKILRMLFWLIDNPLEPKWDVSSDFKFGKGKYRWRNDFKFICTYISHYTKDKKDYDELCKELYDCHRRYINEELVQKDDGKFPFTEEVFIE